MKATDAIKLSIDMGKQITLGYLGDLSDEEMLKRPCPGCNHINWQVGHLISSEHEMMLRVSPGDMPNLPAGFSERYSKEGAKNDSPADFLTKTELLALFESVRTGTLAALAKQSETDLDKETGIQYAPTVGSLFELQGGHWLMHVGQWAVVRRQCGRPPLF